jgi:hypothetical protein
MQRNVIDVLKNKEFMHQVGKKDYYYFPVLSVLEVQSSVESKNN